jgi:hypothetical protein
MEAVRGKAAVFTDKGRSSRSDGSAASQPSENEFSGFGHFDRIDRCDLCCIHDCFPLPNATVHGCVERIAAFYYSAGNNRSAISER